MRRILDGLGAGMILVAMASSAQAQTQPAGVYEVYSPMTWGSVSQPMSYEYNFRYPGYAAPYAYGPQNNAYNNTGLGSFVNGDNYAGRTAPSLAAGGYYPNPMVAPNNVVRAPVRTRPLSRIIRRRR